MTFECDHLELKRDIFSLNPDLGIGNSVSPYFTMSQEII